MPTRYFLRNTKQTMKLTGGPKGTPDSIGSEWAEVAASVYDDFKSARAVALGFERRVEEDAPVEPDIISKIKAPRRPFLKAEEKEE